MLIPGRRARISLPLARPAAPVLHGAAGPTVVVRDVPGIPDAILGPYGALALAFGAIGGLIRVLWILWRQHLEADAEDRRQRDELAQLLPDIAKSLDRLARAHEARNRRDAATRRRNDP